MGRQIGSQYRETLEESGMALISRNSEYALLENAETGKLELWGANNAFSGAVIEIESRGYEFISERR